jgi:hypothetical protein
VKQPIDINRRKAILAWLFWKLVRSGMTRSEASEILRTPSVTLSKWRYRHLDPILGGDIKIAKEFGMATLPPFAKLPSLRKIMKLTRKVKHL